MLRIVSEKVKAEAKKALSIAECVRNVCLLDAMLDKTGASPAPSDGRRSGSRCPMLKVIVYMVEGTEGVAQNADPRLLEKTDGKENRRRPA